ncbi:MAG: hypothetical protein LBJ00_11440 [Planctomycetaceae bacterium]|nr:hypothetical protein [Planctomycetaceae bacterium]
MLSCQTGILRQLEQTTKHKACGDFNISNITSQVPTGKFFISRGGVFCKYTVAGKAIGFALEQPLHVIALACSASGILK